MSFREISPVRLPSLLLGRAVIYMMNTDKNILMDLAARRYPALGMAILKLLTR